MTRHEARQRVIDLLMAIEPVLARLEPEAEDDPAGLLDDLAVMREAYQVAGQAVAQVAFAGAVVQQIADEGLQPPFTYHGAYGLDDGRQA